MRRTQTDVSLRARFGFSQLLLPDDEHLTSLNVKRLYVKRRRRLVAGDNFFDGAYQLI